MITGGGSRAANIPPKTSAFRMRSLELASAEWVVKVEIKARAIIISANFFHIRDPSFRVVLFVFYFFRRKVKKIYSIRIGEERTGARKKKQNDGENPVSGRWLEAGGESIDDDAFSVPWPSD